MPEGFDSVLGVGYGVGMTNKQAGAAEAKTSRLVAESQTDHDETVPVTAREAGFYNAGYHTGLADALARLQALQDVPPIPES